MLQHVLVIYYFFYCSVNSQSSEISLILIVLPVFPLFCERLITFKKDHNFIILEVNFFILFSKKIRLQVLDVINF